MLIPFLHRVVVRPDKVDESDEVIRRAKAAGIEVQLDKREQKAVEIGTIISIGNTFGKGFDSEVLPEVGDKIYFAKYAGKTVRDNGEDLLILNDDDVVAIIKE